MSESLVRGRFHSGSHSVEASPELGPKEHFQKVTFLKLELFLGLVEH